MEKLKLYVVHRILGGLVLAAVAIWGISFILGQFGHSDASKSSQETTHEVAALNSHGMAAAEHHTPSSKSEHKAVTPAVHKSEAVHDKPAAHAEEEPHTEKAHAGGHEEEAVHDASHPVIPTDQPPGVAFVTAAIAPMDYELNHRWWGWRPNDVIQVTDNVNNFQLGVLEVTRRTIVTLAERISRTGASDSFNIHLENAMNWLMIKANAYWFPSPESKYKDSLNELNTYMQRLKEGQASFYTRTDNLIPLLQVFEDIMGSCEENLVKTNERDGDAVSHFKADNYFYYAQGVASAMGIILEAVAVDFGPTVESRRGSELLQSIIHACHHAQDIQPWFVTNASLSGILANHRANMAAPISHARFSLGILIKTLST